MGVFSFVKAGGKKFGSIVGVKPSVNKSKLHKALSDVNLTALKTKGSIKKKSQDFDKEINKVQSKLGQTTQKLKGEPVTKSGFTKGKDLREKKMGGGMMGRRMGYSQGSSKGKVPTTPKEKSLAKLAPPKDRITFGDVVAGRTKGKRMQAKHGTKDPMRDLMIDRKKQSLKTRSGATRPKPNENFDPNNPINKRKKQFKQEANKGMK